MKLSKKELQLISDTEKVGSAAPVKVAILLAIVISCGAAFFFGYLDADYFAVICVASAILAILAPHIGGANQKDIISLLQRVRAESEHEQTDPVIDALSRSRE